MSDQHWDNQQPPPGQSAEQQAQQNEGQAQAEAARASGHVPGAEVGRLSTTEGAVAPAVDNIGRPQLDPCPQCKIGLLYIIAYDEAATHESGQPLFAPRKASGGSALRSCLHCGFGDSVALAPSDSPPDPRNW
jgi:hypothetical protein